MKHKIDKQQLLDAPEEDYMNQDQLDFFKALLTVNLHRYGASRLAA